MQNSFNQSRLIIILLRLRILHQNSLIISERIQLIFIYIFNIKCQVHNGLRNLFSRLKYNKNLIIFYPRSQKLIQDLKELKLRIFRLIP